MQYSCEIKKGINEELIEALDEAFIIIELVFSGKDNSKEVQVTYISSSLKTMLNYYPCLEDGNVDEIYPSFEKKCINAFQKLQGDRSTDKLESYIELQDKFIRESILKLEADKILVKFQDCTDIKKTSDLLRQYKYGIDEAPDMVMYLGIDRTIIAVNKAVEKALGYTKDELIGSDILKITRKKNKTSEVDMLKSMNTVYYRKDGGFFPVEVRTSKLFINNKFIYVSIIRDITERKDMENKVHLLSYYDPITSLPNKVLFEKKVNEAVSTAEVSDVRFALLHLDLDGYKKINEIMGRSGGDELLKTVGKRFNSIINENIFAARAGGDSFDFIIFNLKDDYEIKKVAIKILEEVKKPYIICGQELYVTGSIGISKFPEQGNDAETVMKNANIAMHVVKKKGKNNYSFFDPNMQKREYERIIIESDLHHALEKEEFEVYYQPKVNVLNKKVVGMEALIRWIHPKVGIVPPDKFIGLAEETGLIIPIGEWVMYEACKQNKHWIDAGYPPMRISVNLSAKQFEQDNLVEVVDNILEKTGLNTNYLEFEITETMAISADESVFSVLREFKKRGIRISLDDFGTGYSSLKYIQMIPADILKIDKSFINDISDSSHEAVIDMIIKLASKLKLSVIAEGVETEEQMELLQDKNCNEMQGYLFGKPMRKEEFEKLLKKQ